MYETSFFISFFDRIYKNSNENAMDIYFFPWDDLLAEKDDLLHISYNNKVNQIEMKL